MANLLQPKRSKFAKDRKGNKGYVFGQVSTAPFLTESAQFALYATECGKMSSRQVVTMLQTLKKKLVKFYSVHLRVFPHKPVSKKALGVRMGGGKGPTDLHIVIIKKNRVLIEIVPKAISADREVVLDAFRITQSKLSVRTAILERKKEVTNKENLSEVDFTELKDKKLRDSK